MSRVKKVRKESCKEDNDQQIKRAKDYKLPKIFFFFNQRHIKRSDNTALYPIAGCPKNPFVKKKKMISQLSQRSNSFILQDIILIWRFTPDKWPRHHIKAACICVIISSVAQEAGFSR